MTNEKMIRDMLGSPVPQIYNEELNSFVVKTVDGSTVTTGDIDFRMTKLLRDRLGSVIPQLWDPVNNKWVVDTGQGQGGEGGETDYTLPIASENQLGGIKPDGTTLTVDETGVARVVNSRQIHSSTSNPTNDDGKNGDLWIKYKEVLG